MKTCDHKSVGVIVLDPEGNHLLLTRAKPPAGRAPIAGHVDEHGGSETAAKVEAEEEAGLRLSGLRLLADGYVGNICRRPPSLPSRPGHHWWIYTARVGAESAMNFSDDETRGGGWVTPGELQALADRTVAYALGRVHESEWQAQPGLEPVWAHWLFHLDVITLDPGRLEDIAAIYERPAQS
jgi:8-oxo-dGTP pyrophosphatase MutT (NUDIX family)